MSLRAVLLASLGVSALAGKAGAGGFQMQQNASGLGNAYAGSAAVAEDASTIFYNPAGMSELKNVEVSFGGTFTRQSYQFANQGSIGTYNSAGATGGDAGRPIVAPNAYLSVRLSNALTAGIGFGSPFAMHTSYDTPWLGGAQGNELKIRTYNINPSLAWKINETVSVGFGVNWQTMQMNYQRQLATVPVVPPGLPGNTPLTLDLDDSAWGWNVGALFKLTPATKLGVSYRSRIKHSLNGAMVGGSPIQLVNTAVGGNITTGVTLPDQFIASLSHRFNERWELLGDVSWTGWSSFRDLDIYKVTGGGASSTTPASTLRADFRNTWRVALGATYTVNDAVKLRMGVANDESPIKGAATRPVWLPETKSIWLSGGVQWRFKETAKLDIGAAYLTMRETDIDNNQTASTLGRVTGTYRNSTWILGLQYSAGF
ncbi:MAG: outer membrane protein transport protein [Pseudomonadota bacterium]